jgi:hypothetical protein
MASSPAFYTSKNKPNWAWLARYADMDSFPIMNLYMEPEDGRAGMISLASWCLVTDMSHINDVMHRITPTLSNTHYLYTFGDAVTPLSLQGVTYVNVTSDNMTKEELVRMQGQTWADWQIDRRFQWWSNNAPPSGLSSLYWFYIQNRIRSDMDVSQPIGSRPWIKNICIVIFNHKDNTLASTRTGVVGKTINWLVNADIPRNILKIKGVLTGMDIKLTDASTMKCPFTLRFKALSITESPSIGFTVSSPVLNYVQQTR